MNDTDVTGPLPIIPGDEPPGQPGWIPAGAAHTDSDLSTTGELPPVADEPQLTGADPDLPWGFAMEPATTPEPLIAPDETTALPVVPRLEDDTAAAAGPPPPKPPASKSRHGQPAPLSRAWNVGVASAIAVAAVVVGIFAFNHASNSPKPAPNGAGPAFVLPTAAITGQGAVGTASSPPGLAALPKATATGVPAASASAGVPANAPSITVLNETTTHGLAATEAARLRGAGWTVRRVTNVSARQPETTVFYDPSQEAAAKALVASVPSVKVALPRPSYLLATGGLIVVVAADAR